MKKGFTLVELLCVIVIIAVISLITFPRITSYIRDSKESLLVTQIKDLEKSGEKWALDNYDKLDKYHINDTLITLDLLKNYGYLEKDEVINPKTKKEMNGCILIHYDENKYSYKYLDDIETNENEMINCTNSSYPLNDYYVIYYINSDGEDAKIENVNSPFYELILKNNNVKVLGEKEDGLYELEDEYVFRGTNVNNYVRYNDLTYRILSINKTDYSMKLVRIENALSSSSEFYNTIEKANEEYSNEELSEDSKTAYSKLINTWNDGLVDNTNISVQSLRVANSNHVSNNKVMALSLYDYAIASLNDNCYNNISSNECKLNNYIANMFYGKDFWTMDQKLVDGERKYWVVKKDGNIDFVDKSSGPYYYATTIKLPINIHNNKTDATGSDSLPYEIE